MTVWFLSNGKTEEFGWVATVGNNPRPAAASIHVFDTIVANIADATVHVRYDGTAEVTATVTGGRGDAYRYVWQKSTDDGSNGGTQCVGADGTDQQHHDHNGACDCL